MERHVLPIREYTHRILNLQDGKYVIAAVLWRFPAKNKTIQQLNEENAYFNECSRRGGFNGMGMCLPGIA